jgi:hypothetical protein
MNNKLTKGGFAMSIGYELTQKFMNYSFDYGGSEELIGFISDNYYEAMKIYRTITKQVKEGDKKRAKAHEDLQKLRADEERWRKEDKLPKGFDAEEHATRKEYLADLREEEFDIIYKNQVLPVNKLTYLIVTRMWVFKFLDIIDIKSRKRLGPFASKLLSMVLWPMMKMMELTAKHTDSLAAEKFMKKSLKDLKLLPKKVMKKIMDADI